MTAPTRTTIIPKKRRRCRIHSHCNSPFFLKTIPIPNKGFLGVGTKPQAPINLSRP